MLIDEFDKLIQEMLDIKQIGNADSALNGLQVSRNNSDIKKVAFSVDASMESFKRAIEKKSDLLFVHHGLFWGKVESISGNLYRRLKFLLKNDLALYAVHLPLDLHPEFGNNICIARYLGLKNVESFGTYHGVVIGKKGEFDVEQSIYDICSHLCGQNSLNQNILCFGSEKVKSVGIVSGGAAKNAHEAIEQKLDLFITGESSHEIYHACQEAGLNVIFAGHYKSEQWGVKTLAQKIHEQTDLDTFFIDIPTGY